MYSVIYVIIWEQFVRWVGDVWVGGNVGGELSGGYYRREAKCRDTDDYYNTYNTKRW